MKTAAVLIGAVLGAALGACSPKPPAPVVVYSDAAREATLEVTYLDTIDGTPATHVAVGGRVRIMVDGTPTFTSVAGPFQVLETDDALIITAMGAGAGQIDIETTSGLARVKLTSAPIAKLELFDAGLDRATVALFDASGKRLVDSNLRISGGGAPVTFVDAWDRIALGSLTAGTHEIFVKTDVLAPTRVQVAKVDARSTAAN